MGKIGVCVCVCMQMLGRMGPELELRLGTACCLLLCRLKWCSPETVHHEGV